MNIAAPPELPCSTFAEVTKKLSSTPETIPSVAVTLADAPVDGYPRIMTSSPIRGGEGQIFGLSAKFLVFDLDFGLLNTLHQQWG